jgi:hypothetical protein
MKIGSAFFAFAGSLALAGCAVGPAGPSPHGYAEAPYYGPGGPAYWSSPYSYGAPYAPYGYAGSTLGFGFGGEGRHERDRDWHRHDHDRHDEGEGERHHHAEHSAPGAATTPPTHAAPARPAPPSSSSSKENASRTFHGSAF